MTTALAKFDPHQPRDPHTGEWTDIPGGGGKARTAITDWPAGDLAAFDKAAQGQWFENSGDASLAAIAEAQGFNNLPRRGDLDAEVANGGRRIWRGIAGTRAEEYRSDFLSRRADRRIGTGIYGNGDYFSDEEATARKYAQHSGYGEPGGAVIDAVLPASARVANGKDLERAWVREAGNDPAEAGWKAQQDLGRYAALLGYDALWFPPGSGMGGQMVVLNRSALVVAP